MLNRTFCEAVGLDNTKRMKSVQKEFNNVVIHLTDCGKDLII
jgi:hypothetical protein